MIDFYLASVLLVGLMGMWYFVYGVDMVFKGSTSYQGVYGVENTWVVGLISDIKGA